jgi:hypothetical protein
VKAAFQEEELIFPCLDALIASNWIGLSLGKGIEK